MFDGGLEYSKKKNWKTGGEFLLVKRILFKGQPGERVVSVTTLQQSPPSFACFPVSE